MDARKLYGVDSSQMAIEKWNLYNTNTWMSMRYVCTIETRQGEMQDKDQHKIKSIQNKAINKSQKIDNIFVSFILSILLFCLFPSSGIVWNSYLLTFKWNRQSIRNWVFKIQKMKYCIRFLLFSVFLCLNVHSDVWNFQKSHEKSVEIFLSKHLKGMNFN